MSSFPLLTLDEFRSMCASFAKRINAYPGDLSTLGWTNIKHEEQVHAVAENKQWL